MRKLIPAPTVNLRLAGIALLIVSRRPDSNKPRQMRLENMSPVNAIYQGTPTSNTTPNAENVLSRITGTSPIEYCAILSPIKNFP